MEHNTARCVRMKIRFWLTGFYYNNTFYLVEPVKWMNVTVKPAVSTTNLK